jgi:glucosyl-3-phosphoglycerate phosphatase
MTDAGTRRLVVVRHGETLDNAAGVWQGLKDTELSPVGQAQAEKAAPMVAAYEPEVVVASDLARARVTAERVGEAAGMPVRLDPRLREIDVGEWQGVTTAEVRNRDPELLRAMGRGEDVRRGRTGETVADLATRVRAALDDVIAALSPGRVAVVVCHGVAARAGVASLVGLDQMQAQKVLWGLDNCHWAVLAEASLVSGAPVPPRWRIDAWNVGA